MAKRKKEVLNPKEGDFACRHIALEMEYPKTKPDIEAFFYYLYHEGVELFIDHDTNWFLLFQGECTQLTKGGKCKIPEEQADECLQHGHGVRTVSDTAKYHFRNEYELVKYLKEKRPALFKKLYPGTRKIAKLKEAPPPLKKAAIIPGKERKGSAPEGVEEEHRCFDCESCCSYINIVSEKPTTESKLKTLLWYVNHTGCQVYLDHDTDWSILFDSTCLQLSEMGLCQAYDRRPSICRKFSSNNCHGLDMSESIKHFFGSPRALMSHMAKRRPAFFKRLSKNLKKLATGAK